MFVYWIRRTNDTNIWSEGYVGVSKNPSERLIEHYKSRVNHKLKKWLSTETTIMEIIFEGTEEDCLSAELLFRPREYIGYNISKGGSYPPEKPALGKRWKISDTSNYKKPKSKEHRLNIGKGQLGNKRGPLSELAKKNVSKAVSELKWYHNGVICKRSVECPQGFVAGRIIRKNK